MKNHSLFAKAKKIFWPILTLTSCLLFSGILNAQPTLGFNKILQGLSSPVDIKNAGDSSNRLFIVEQSGRIKIYKNGTLLSTPFLDVSSIIKSGGEQGLLSVAFHQVIKEPATFLSIIQMLTQMLRWHVTEGVKQIPMLLIPIQE